MRAVKHIEYILAESKNVYNHAHIDKTPNGNTKQNGHQYMTRYDNTHSHRAYTSKHTRISVC